MTSRARKRRAVQRPTVTAGLKCPPETWPTAYAIVSTERPKANATTSRPMPTPGKAAASTALPQPPRTSHSVPRNSAVSLCESEYSFIALFLSDRESVVFTQIARVVITTRHLPFLEIEVPAHSALQTHT